MNMNYFKKVETKDKSLALKIFDGDDLDLDEEYVAFITRTFIKFFKRNDRNDMKVIGSR